MRIKTRSNPKSNSTKHFIICYFYCINIEVCTLCVNVYFCWGASKGVPHNLCDRIYAISFCALINRREEGVGGEGQLKIMLEEGEEKYRFLLLNSIKMGEGCSAGVLGAQQKRCRHSTIDSSSWSALDGNTGKGVSGCGGVVIDSRLDAGVNSMLDSSTVVLRALISARLKQ